MATPRGHKQRLIGPTRFLNKGSNGKRLFRSGPLDLFSMDRSHVVALAVWPTPGPLKRGCSPTPLLSSPKLRPWSEFSVSRNKDHMRISFSLVELSIWNHGLSSGHRVRRGYHAVRTFYLKYSWEYFMQKKVCMTYSFIVETPNILGVFLLFVCQDQLGENYLTYSHSWWYQNTLV